MQARAGLESHYTLRVGFQVGQVLRQGALRHGERVACVLAGGSESEQGEQAFTYAALDLAARGVAEQLQQQGLVPGGRVALSAANGVEFLAGFFGASYAGVTVVPIPILSAAPETRLRVTRSRCSAALVDSGREPLLRAACPELNTICLTTALRMRTTTLTPSAAATAAQASSSALDLPADTDAMLLFTSGTTGGPKAARITHASLLAHTAALVHHTLHLSEHDVVLGVLPWTHSFGLRMCVLAPFYAGAQVLAFERFDPRRTLAVMDAGRVTWAPAVPTMFAAWTATRSHAGVARGLRSALSAGAPLPRELRLRAEARLGCPVRQGYGLTEATFSTIDDGRGEEVVTRPPGAPAHTHARTVESGQSATVRDESEHVGAPVWGVELRIRDEGGQDVPAGDEGEVWVRGANVMAGYLDDHEATRAVFDEGWLRTGDLGRVDALGRLVLVDRLKDLILRGGANIYPSEVEDALAAHPAVSQVAVIGRPDDYYGEQVVAVIVARGDAPTASELDAHARLYLAKNKLPVEYVFVPELPLGPSGKVLKRTLRELYAYKQPA